MTPARGRDLHVRLGGSHVLQGVSFEVPEGAVTALLGRNGVGKTTTLRALLGLVPREGHGPARRRRHRSASRRYRIVQRGVGLRARGPRRLRRRSPSPRTSSSPCGTGRARYDLVYELFPELRERAAQRAGTLSGGQQQMVAIARALLNENVILLVDEPTKGLAPMLVAEVAAALERVCAESTVLLVEQNLEVVRRVAEHVVVLDTGRVVHTGPARELLDDRERVHALLGVAA